MRSRQHPFFPRQTDGRANLQRSFESEWRGKRCEDCRCVRIQQTRTEWQQRYRIATAEIDNMQYGEALKSLQTFKRMASIHHLFSMSHPNILEYKDVAWQNRLRGVRWMSAIWSGLSRIALVSLRQPHICQLTHRISRSLTLRCVWRWTDMGTGQCF